MAYPGVIKRPLFEDEFSIYLNTAEPIPLIALASLLGQLDRAARSVEGIGNLFLELSDFALGSAELRCRVVGPGRIAQTEAARQERLTKAAESTAHATWTAAGAAVVSAVAAVVAASIAHGGANPSAHRVACKYQVQEIYVRAPDEAPKVITREQIEEGRVRRLNRKRHKQALKERAETRALMEAMDRNEIVEIAGWFIQEHDGNFVFETMNGNTFPVHFDRAQDLQDSSVVVRAVVHDSPSGLQLEVLEFLAKLSDF